MNAKIYLNTIKYMYNKKYHKFDYNIDGKDKTIYLSVDNVGGHSRISHLLKQQDDKYYCYTNLFEYDDTEYKKLLVSNGFQFKYGRYVNENFNLDQLNNILCAYIEKEKDNKYDKWLYKN